MNVNGAQAAFDSLAGPSIVYGTSQVTLGGHIGGGTKVPAGSVLITLAGVAQSAAIDPATGNFSSVFDTTKLGVSGSPYAISYSYAGDSTYGAVQDTSKTLTVSPRVLLVKATDTVRIYGDTIPAFQATYGNFAFAEGPSVLSGTLTFSTNAPAGNAPVGTYTITPSGLSSPNYTIDYQTGTLTISPRSLTITANNATKTYGDPDPSFTADYSGFATGEGPANLSGTLTFLTNEPGGNAPVGSYSITPTGVSSPNYKITFASGVLSVTTRALTVTAHDASKTYGDADPNFSAAYKGFAPGEGVANLSGVLTFTTNEPAGNAPVGSYAITPSGLSSTNYTISFVPGTLNVTPRSLTITANNASKTFGQADPVFSATPTGLAPGESLANLAGTLVFSTNEGNPLTAPAGTYSVTPSGVSSSNYTIAFVPGVLTVNQVTTSLVGLTSPSIAVGTASTSFAGKLQTNSVIPVGQMVSVALIGSGGTLAGGTGAIQGDGTFSVVINTGAVPVGTYTVQYAYAGDHNFAGTSGSGTFSVASGYQVNALYDQTRAHKSGSTIPIRLSVTDSAGNDVSSPSLVVTAVQLVDSSGKKITPTAQGGSNPGNMFRNVGSGYLYNLDTTGLAAGTYTLYVTVGNDPTLHAVKIVIS